MDVTGCARMGDSEKGNRSIDISLIISSATTESVTSNIFYSTKGGECLQAQFDSCNIKEEKMKEKKKNI